MPFHFCVEIVITYPHINLFTLSAGIYNSFSQIDIIT